MVYVLLAPGFEEAEALVPADMLRRAGIETALVSIGDQAVMGSHGISVAADETLDRVGLSNAEMLVLPGGGTGVKNLGGEPKVEQLVREALERVTHHLPRVVGPGIKTGLNIKMDNPAQLGSYGVNHQIAA